ncbi:MAG: diacylglycerol kinase family protein [Candidatus Pacebacteria bacterium]|nr:diacylglycerol kinase family protein [Candidatus Paceibacterota bacterium]
MFSLKEFIQSIAYAIRGLKYTFQEEQSFRIQSLVALIVIILMFYFPTTRLEKAILLMMIIIVLALELINTISEDILDIVEPNFQPKVQVIKDTMAAAVILSAFGALIIGLIILFPYFQ